MKQQQQEKKNRVKELLPFSLHVINIDYYRPSYFQKRNKHRTTQSNMACTYYNSKQKYQKSNNHRSSLYSNSIYNKKKERYDQFCFSDYKLKYGTSPPNQDEIQCAEAEQNFRNQEKKKKFSEQLGKNQREHKSNNFIQAEQKVIKPETAYNKSQKTDNKKRNIYSHTQRRSYLPNIKGLKQKSIQQKNKDIAQTESQLTKLDGWTSNLYPYDIDKKLDIIQYTTTRGESRNKSKAHQRKINYNNKVKNSIFIFQ